MPRLPRGKGRALLAVSSALALLAVLWLARGAKPGKDADAVRAIDPGIEGVDLVYLTFNKDNEKKLEVRCRESQQGEGDRLLMKQITATLFKADKLDDDIHVSADAGWAGNDFNDFLLEGRALITSPRFTLSSRSFDLKSLDLLSTREATDIQLSGLTARAQRGLVYVIKDKIMKLLQVKGVMTRNGGSYDFETPVFRVNQKKNWLLLDQAARVDGADSSLRARRVAMQFNQDFVNVEWALAGGNCRFRTFQIAENGQRQDREITGERIKLLYEEGGRLQGIEARGGAKISLATRMAKNRVRSDVLDIVMDPGTQMLKEVRMLSRGTLSSQGQDSFRVECSSLNALYDEAGELVSVQAKGKCKFATDDFSGLSTRLEHDASTGEIAISGNSVIDSGRNRFESGDFLLRTGKKSLSAEKGVKATLVPGKKNALLGVRPAFVTAAAMETSERGETSRFTGNVSLFQDEVELRSGELLFSSSGAGISCRGGVELKFASDGDTLTLRGKTVSFDPDGVKLVVEDEARLEQGGNALAARRIELNFDRDDKLKEILASDQAVFKRRDISGKAQSLRWDYAGRIVLFRDGAEITRKGAGTTRGRELRFDLERDEISVSGAGERSETTIRHDGP